MKLLQQGSECQRTWEKFVKYQKKIMVTFTKIREIPYKLKYQKMFAYKRMSIKTMNLAVFPKDPKFCQSTGQAT